SRPQGVRAVAVDVIAATGAGSGIDLDLVGGPRRQGSGGADERSAIALLLDEPPACSVVQIEAVLRRAAAGRAGGPGHRRSDRLGRGWARAARFPYATLFRSSRPQGVRAVAVDVIAATGAGSGIDLDLVGGPRRQ